MGAYPPRLAGSLICAPLAVTVVSPRMGDKGWPFANVDAFPGAEIDLLNNAEHIRDIYLKADPLYSGRYIDLHLCFTATIHTLLRRFTVPVLWDSKRKTIVNNESSEIIRMFNTAFNHILPSDKASLDIYPAAHRAEIDKLNEWVYDTINSTS